ncbi:histidine--tRNA ligase [Candidatus Kaiserbacteria bacterium]|nr:histidine--tRNA ligase [Candidatus Kaiserbacteria bacterium]
MQEYIFETMKNACERFGYESYDASVLEPAELYRGKTSEEIVAEQTYTFTDRGDREVTLRPEMTPTIARMVAAKRRELTFPLRWYTIANVFRYERPQRGRLREHWQLNADIFGVEGVEAEVEIISLAHQIMLDLGANESDFEIRVNDRRLLNGVFKDCSLTEEEERVIMRLLDKRHDMADFDEKLSDAVGPERANKLKGGLSSAASSAHLEELLSLLYKLGITNVHVDMSIVRGFDYYTGTVFEVFDTSPDNNRSLFGGGRYDNLLQMFGEDAIPAVGFGMGDVTAHDFLEAHGLLPRYVPATELMICVMEKEHIAHALRLAQDLRREDVAVAVNFSGKKIGDQVKQANKLGIPFIVAVGDKERDSGHFTLKHLPTGNEFILPAENIPAHMLSALG